MHGRPGYVECIAMLLRDGDILHTQLKDLLSVSATLIQKCGEAEIVGKQEGVLQLLSEL